MRCLIGFPEAIGCAMMAALLVNGHQQNTGETRNSMFVRCAEAYCTASGGRSVLSAAVFYFHGSMNGFSCGATVLQGIARAGPILVVFAIGKQPLYAFAHRQFDSGRSERDGAVVASLLESTGVSVGRPWWLQLPPAEMDMSCQELDHRRHWREGVVVSVGKSSFQVAMIDKRIRRNAAGHGRRPSQSRELVTVPMPATLANPQELAHKARAQLRCMPWSMLTATVMSNNKSDGRDFSLSRGVALTEVIDYFLTHSWHDNAEAKWRVLSAVKEELGPQGQERTLWLDKTCIDQRCIRDGLTVLPIVVMSCKRLLCLWGPSYPSRLWCVWELFTLIAFGSTDSAAKRLVIKPLDKDGDSAGTLLQKFDVRDARCYDPNEQARLLDVIGALGLARFSDRIQELGRKLAGDRPGWSMFANTASKAQRSIGHKTKQPSDAHQSLQSSDGPPELNHVVTVLGSPACECSSGKAFHKSVDELGDTWAAI